MFGGLILRPFAATWWELDPLDPINRGLLRFLPLTDGAGEQLLDISPARRNGATVGSTTRPTTQRGKALGVSSGTNYGLVRSGAVVSGLRAYTVSFWVQTAASAAFTNGGAFYCERASSGNDILKVEGLGFGSGANVAFFTMRDDGGTLLQGFGSTVINDGRAHLCTFVKNGSSILYYVDGKADISSTWSGSDSFTNSGLESRIASDPADPLAFTNGNFTNLRLFSRALLPQEIQRLYRDPWAGVIDPAARLFFAVRSIAPTTNTGTVSSTLAAATLASTATVALKGTTSATLAAATLSATGTVSLTGTASATLAATTVVAAGTVALTGSTTATLAAVTLAGTGTISLSATLTSTLDDATLAATGTAGTVVTGTLAATLDAATLAAASTLVLRGTTTTTLANATLAGTGTLSLRATSSVTLGNVALSATGTNGNVVNAIVLVWNGVRI